MTETVLTGRSGVTAPLARRTSAAIDCAIVPPGQLTLSRMRKSVTASWAAAVRREMLIAERTQARSYCLAPPRSPPGRRLSVSQD